MLPMRWDLCDRDRGFDLSYFYSYYFYKRDISAILGEAILAKQSMCLYKKGIFSGDWEKRQKRVFYLSAISSYDFHAECFLYGFMERWLCDGMELSAVELWRGGSTF